FGQIIRADGAALGGSFPISFSSFGTEQPGVAFNGTNFLVVWTASDGSGGDNTYTLPRAQLVSPDGALIGGEIALASGAFDVEVGWGGGRFLAVARDSDTESAVYGQLLDADGTLVGPVIDIDTTPAGSGGPKEVFFDAMAQRFIVTFQDASSQNPGSFTEADLFART